MTDAPPAARGGSPESRRDQPRADLHLHSTCSDGLMAPAAVMDLAADLGIGVVALTDHDTLAGLPEAAERAAARGIHLIMGVEVSTQHPRSGERHVLGHAVDPSDDALRAGLDENVRAREERLGRMVDALRACGIALEPEDVRREAAGAIGRPHVADALVRQGVVRSRQEAFDRWLGDGKPAHVPKVNLDAARAIRLIHGAGGVATLAHPGRRWDPALLEDLVRAGLDGVEVMHPSNGAPEMEALREAARRFDLVVTGGSDCHGDREGIQSMRMQRVPASYADDVLRRAERRRAQRPRASGGGAA